MIALLLLGCTAPDLPEEWELDRLRLLAIRAEPAEPRPGDLVSFTALQYVPDEAEWSSVWFACMDGDIDGCSLDPALMEQLQHADELTPEEAMALFQALREAGFVGAQPGMDLTWAVPADALDGLSEAESLEGRSGSLTVTLSTADDTELTIKRIPVSLATTPNHNPDVAPLEFDGNPVDPEATLTVDAGNDVEVHAALVGEPEEYTYVTTEGESETRTEKPSWRWYTSGGTLSEVGDGSRGPSFADEGQTEATYSWITPEEPGTYTLAAVVLDGRGGMGWQRLDVVVE